MKVEFVRERHDGPLLLRVVPETTADYVALGEFAKQLGKGAFENLCYLHFPSLPASNHRPHFIGPEALQFAPMSVLRVEPPAAGAQHPPPGEWTDARIAESPAVVDEGAKQPEPGVKWV